MPILWSFRREPFAADLVVDDVHTAVLIDGVIRQVHEHIGGIVTDRFLILARRESKNAMFLTLPVNASYIILKSEDRQCV